MGDRTTEAIDRSSKWVRVYGKGDRQLEGRAIVFAAIGIGEG
jgi:hypothetical protein